jgi:hypothetical protein
MLNRFLFTQTDNSALIVFRVFFGLLLFLETAGAIVTGWITKTLVEPDFTFTFIGFEWLQPLPGNGMYYYYALMSIFGLLVMLGYRYRLSLGIFTLMWTATYLMQKASYNNHYYLLIFICGIMWCLPANKYFSLDVKRSPSIKSISMPAWCKYVIIGQLLVVYTYAAIAKLYPDWLDFTVAKNLMLSKREYPLIGSLLQEHWIHVGITYGGILFDGLIVPALLYKPTRKVAFIASIFFHLFNSIVFQVGIFPYLSLAFILFFFPAKTIHSIFLKKKPFYDKEEVIIPHYKKAFLAITSIYFIIQVALPLRHWFIKDDVLWTEEGHRLSWRMMLRSKSGFIQFKVVNKANNKLITMVQPKDFVSKKQQRMLATKPDVIWQFAQHLKQVFAKNGQDVAVYAIGQISVNGKPFKPLINPDVDLAAETWKPLTHHSWILPSEKH